jgi:hypothetical protein
MMSSAIRGSSIPAEPHRLFSLALAAAVFAAWPQLARADVVTWNLDETSSTPVSPTAQPCTPFISFVLLGPTSSDTAP